MKSDASVNFLAPLSYLILLLGIPGFIVSFLFLNCDSFTEICIRVYCSRSIFAVTSWILLICRLGSFVSEKVFWIIVLNGSSIPVFFVLFFRDSSYRYLFCLSSISKTFSLHIFTSLSHCHSLGSLTVFFNTFY